MREEGRVVMHDNAALFCVVNRVRSEDELESELDDARVADALTQEAVEVEEAGRDQRVDVVCVIERIEHLDHRNDRETFTQMNRPLNAPVKREVLVVLARSVAIGRCAHARRDRLRAARLYARVPF